MADLQGMIADPQFQSLPPADKRNALSSLTGDKSFASLSDADTMRFVSSFGVKAQPPVDTLTQQTQAAAMSAGVGQRPGIPNVPVPQGMNPLQASQQGYAIPPGVSLPPGAAAIGQAGQRLDRVAQLQQRAIQSPTPVTAATSVIMPAVGLEDKLPSTARAAQKFQDVSAAVGQHTVPMTDKLSDVLQEASRLSQSLTMPKVIGGYIQRVADMAQEPITFQEARDFYSTAASKLTPDEAMKIAPRMVRMISQFKQALGETLQDVADKGGKLEEFQQAMNEFRQASQMKNVVNKVGKMAGVASGVYGAYRAVQDIRK